MKEKSLVRSWIRATTCNNVRYYSVVYAIAGIVDTRNPRDYWYSEKPGQGQGQEKGPGQKVCIITFG